MEPLSDLSSDGEPALFKLQSPKLVEHSHASTSYEFVNHVDLCSSLDESFTSVEAGKLATTQRMGWKESPPTRYLQKAGQ